VELGINYIDMSEASAEGRSETLVGKALKGKRSRVIIATKFGTHRIVGPSEQPGSRSWLIKSVENSLKRLDTDYIDLYIMHEPDPGTPIEETLRALDDLVRIGKVRYIGCSVFTAWQLCEAMWTSKAHNLESFVTVYLKYNLITRNDIEREYVPCCQTHGVGIVPIAPQAGGFLTGKYQRGKKIPEGARFTTVPPLVDATHQDLRRYD
jgi:aryl-alcohol dehydrogenase-like predicted oxidoreductase